MAEISIQSQIEIHKKNFYQSLKDIKDLKDLESIRIKYLGRKGIITEQFKSLGKLSLDDRRIAGRLLNDLKQNIQNVVEEKISHLSRDKKVEHDFDYTLPGNQWNIGRIHPINGVLKQIKSCFKEMGFSVAQGPEIETEYYNFEALNIPKGHPARDMQDTLYIDESNEIVLRTHTSPVQIRVMEKISPPIRIIAPGRCYRRDTPDATHSPVFHQVEGLCVDEGISFADLKGVILSFAKRMFGSDVKIRFRPSFFPFTEPSAEYDFSCLICHGKGCRVCSETGWVEISGAGMVNPAVFENVGYDSEKYTGYAFGMGVERIAMLLYQVNDIRLFYENDARFLHQF
jgi:phenylalanyl-tRNA synthetase alpha chain